MVRYILAHYDLLERMDMDNEMPILIMHKMPRAIVQQGPQQQAQGQPGASRVIDSGNGPGGSAQHHNRMGQPMPSHHMPPPPHPPQNPVGGPPM